VVAKRANNPERADSRIIGFRLPTALASDVKAEAGRRQISLRKLFEEMWELYQKRPAKAKP
jgi:hypothetical protein